MQLHDLGVAVRRLREATRPAALGLPAGRRRVPGLRREELAALTGLSLDYVRRLEQGRRHPSAGVVDALARALRVDRADYERLCLLAGYAPAGGVVPRQAGAGATRLLERLGGTPAFLCDAAWNVVAVNGAWAALQAGAPAGQARDWNVAWRTFRSPLAGVRRSAEETAGFQAMLVARLRAASLRYPDDEPLAALVDELRATSRAFDTRWRTPVAVGAYENTAVFRHPDGADIRLDGSMLAVPGDDLVAVLLTAAPGSADAARLAEVVGSGTPGVLGVGFDSP